MEKAVARVKAACPPCRRRSSSSGMTKDAERERRLAAALRDNLKRRKAQARAEPVSPAAADESPVPITPSPEHP